jgi:hypothetical protein
LGKSDSGPTKWCRSGWSTTCASWAKQLLGAYILSRHGVSANLAVKTLAKLIRRHIEIIVGLRSEPELRRGPEVAREA